MSDVHEGISTSGASTLSASRVTVGFDDFPAEDTDDAWDTINFTMGWTTTNKPETAFDPDRKEPLVWDPELDEIVTDPRWSDQHKQTLSAVTGVKTFDLRATVDSTGAARHLRTDGPDRIRYVAKATGSRVVDGVETEVELLPPTLFDVDAEDPDEVPLTTRLAAADVPLQGLSTDVRTAIIDEVAVRSPYQLWLDAGNVGDEAVFLASLIGGPGPQGDQGPEGQPGPQGVLGDQGPAGNDGTNGLDGAAGTNGLDGAAGTNGLDGAVGPQGTPGLSWYAGTHHDPIDAAGSDFLATFALVDQLDDATEGSTVLARNVGAPTQLDPNAQTTVYFCSVALAADGGLVWIDVDHPAPGTRFGTMPEVGGTHHDPIDNAGADSDTAQLAVETLALVEGSTVAVSNIDADPGRRGYYVVSANTADGSLVWRRLDSPAAGTRLP